MNSTWFITLPKSIPLGRLIFKLYLLGDHYIQRTGNIWPHLELASLLSPSERTRVSDCVLKSYPVQMVLVKAGRRGEVTHLLSKVERNQSLAFRHRGKGEADLTA